MDLFTFKKIIGSLVMPLPLLLALLFISLFLFMRNRRKLAITLQGLAILLLISISNSRITNAIIAPIEYNYHQYQPDTPIDAVVVLGCGHHGDARLPMSAQLYSCSLYRLIEGIHIHKQHPNSRLITSGYGGDDPISNAEVMRDVAIKLGVSPYKITMQTHPKDTAEEAQALKNKLKNTPFVLVTSASHMPRAMAIFQAQGLNPIAAPTDYLSAQGSQSAWWRQLPRSSNIKKIERWWYETLGRIYHSF